MNTLLQPSPAQLRQLVQADRRGVGVTSTDLYILVRRTDPGYAWGASIHKTRAKPKGFAAGECASAQELEAAIRNLIIAADGSNVDDELTVNCQGDRTVWKEVGLRLPIGVRVIDPVESTGARVQNIIANGLCPGTITNPRTIVATDGSVSMHNGHAGYGWVSTSGAFGVGMIGVKQDVCNAELTAIQSALRMVTPAAEATFLVDSMEAMDLINKQITVGHANFATNASRRRQLAQIDRSAVRTVTFTKVTAHAGNILNEGADRLARLARRSSEAGMTKENLWSVARGIRDEVLADYRGQIS